MKAANDALEEKVTELEEESASLRTQLDSLQEEENTQDASVVSKLRRLVQLNETLREQEKQFKASCKQQFEYWQNLVNKAQKTVYVFSFFVLFSCCYYSCHYYYLLYIPFIDYPFSFTITTFPFLLHSCSFFYSLLFLLKGSKEG